MADRLESVKAKVPPSRRAQLLRDLVLIARSDGHVQAEEVDELQSVARGLGLPDQLVFDALRSPVDLD